MSTRINAHAHLLPYPEEIPLFMKEKGIFWITPDKKFMCQGTWTRPVTDPSFFLNEKLDWMAVNNIDKEVVLNLSQLYCNGMSRQDTNDTIRFQNDFNHKLQSEYPDKFIGGFVVQPLYTDDAIREIERCVTEFKMSVLCLPTHYKDANGQWLEIASEYTDPIFEVANEFNLAIEIHPYNAEEIVQLADQFWRFHLIWLCAQTADAYHFYSLLDFGRKYPNTRVCFAHGNQFGQMGYGRRKQGFYGRPDLFKGATPPDENIRLNNVFFDTLVHDVLSFELLVKRQGVSQILAGLDDPYPLGEMESVPDSYPGKVLDEAVDSKIITTSERSQIWYDNVIRWLGNEKL
jgi:aminocarboxymuconate-semialdehyde decarboxylase